MMDDLPPLTLPDGSSNRNPPERCLHPLYSRDPPTQKHQEILQEDQVDGSSNRNPPERCPSPQDSTQKCPKILRCYQNKKLKRIKNEIKEEEEDPYVMGDGPCKEEEIPPGISTDPGDTRDPQRDVKAEVEEEGHVRIKEEEVGRVNRKGKAVLEIGNDGQYRFQNVEKSLLEGEAVTPNHQTVSSNGKKLFWCSECGKCFTHKHSLIVHHRTHTGEKPFSCSKCGKSFSHKSHLSEHKTTHPEVEPFSCSECGRRFRTWRVLAMHQRVHSSENVYQCSKCGQGFFKRLNLKKHERLHRRLKPT